MQEEIRAGSPTGVSLGFTENLFSGYLLKDGNTISICHIVSFYPKEGNVTRFIKGLLNEGYDVRVVMPVAESMEHICFRLGFKKTKEFSHEYGDILVDVWIKKGKKKRSK